MSLRELRWAAESAWLHTRAVLMMLSAVHGRRCKPGDFALYGSSADQVSGLRITPKNIRLLKTIFVDRRNKRGKPGGNQSR